MTLEQQVRDCAELLGHTPIAWVEDEQRLSVRSVKNGWSLWFAPHADWSQCGELIERAKPRIAWPSGSIFDDRPLLINGKFYGDDLRRAIVAAVAEMQRESE